MHTFYALVFYILFFCRSRTRLTRMRSDEVITLCPRTSYMSWNTWGSSNLPSENQKKRKNNPHVGVLVKRLFCVQTEEDYYYNSFLWLKTLLCPLLFTLHSWTRGIQPEGKLLLQIKIRLWWIFGQYWRPLKVPFNEGKTCWQLISPVFSYFYLSDSSGRVCWTSLLLEISLLWSHKRCWHQLPRVGDNNPSEVFVLTLETDTLAASLFISLFFGPFSNLDSTSP